MSEHLTIISVVIASIAIIVAIAGTIISGVLTRDSNKITREASKHAKNAIQVDVLMKLIDRLGDEQMMNISGTIAENGKILQKNGGSVNEFELVKYMTIFSEINRYLDLGVLDIKNVYNGFVNYVVPLSKNKEVLEYVKEIRKQQNPNTWKAIYILGEKLEEVSKTM